MHEVAHITHGNHSADFYELMADIEKHWALSKSKGLAVVDRQGFPVSGGRRLDGSALGAAAKPRRRKQPSREEVRKRCLEAAMRRQKARVRMRELGLNRAYTVGGSAGARHKPMTKEELRQARLKFFRPPDPGLEDEELAFNASQEGLDFEGTSLDSRTITLCLRRDNLVEF